MQIFSLNSSQLATQFEFEDRTVGRTVVNACLSKTKFAKI